MGLVEGIKQVKEFFLSPFLACDELDVVEEEDIDVAKASPKFIYLVPSERGYDLIHPQ